MAVSELCHGTLPWEAPMCIPVRAALNKQYAINRYCVYSTCNVYPCMYAQLTIAHHVYTVYAS